ncbi:hypothetical protein [Legionella cincinnatiensis]|uniref:Uncharacterized protein n=1 Tax=Legionella cincinnatiensis TaxID=28085 RepID=A0A378IME3_9GAMM|nr:hypothetical protein [Legionella cincinnatiensis]KTC78433.1 hypothetical protein Lcin_3410 [Legionella cincinnatiensis]STX36418.1 Uncharacterised protein [Legionella cincinnatiensis]
MPFSTKLIADYVEMINGELDHIPVRQPAQFKFIVEELQDMISWSFSRTLKNCFFKAPPKPDLPYATKEQLNYISYCLNNPQDFVKSAADYAEYKKILTQRITAKINEFQSMDTKAKWEYIQFQKENHSAPLQNIPIPGGYV